MTVTTVIGLIATASTHLMFRTAKGRLITATVVAAVVVPSTAWARTCTYNAASADQSSPGMFRMQAGTNQDQCPGRTARAESWVSQVTWGCAPPAQIVAGKCTKEETDGTTNAITFVAGAGCGSATGLSNHSMWNPHVEIQNLRETTLFAGDCEDPPACQDQCGGDPQCLCACEGGEWRPGIEGGEPFCDLEGTPILIALNKTAKYKLTSVKQGVAFDLDADGTPEQTAWTHHSADVAFLALDRDGDGAITSGEELFGSKTVPGTNNGFIALRRLTMESNGGILRGEVSSNDPLFARLLLWTDANHNGISEPVELRPASEVLSAVALSYTFTDQKDEFGNRFLIRGSAQLRTAPGRNLAKDGDEDRKRSIVIWDVVFATK